MEIKNMPYIVCVKTNSSGCITTVNSSGFLSDTADWVEIDRDYGDEYHHAQENYFPKTIMTKGGAYCYRLVDGQVRECTAEEIATQEDAKKAVSLLKGISAWDELDVAYHEGVNSL